MLNLRTSYAKYLAGIISIMALLALYYSVRNVDHTSEVALLSKLSSSSEKIINMLRDMNSNIRKTHLLLSNSNRPASSLSHSEIKREDMSEAKSCTTVLADLIRGGKALLSGPDVFGLSSKCLSKLYGKPLRKATKKEAIDYGEESIESFEKPHCFKRSLTESEKRLHFRSRMAEFQKLLENAGFPFFMDSGTLIGSLRHLGMAPWDDDIDVFVELRHRDKLAKLLMDYQKVNKTKTWVFSFTGQADKHMKFRVQRPYFLHTEVKVYTFCFDMFFYERDLKKHTVSLKQLDGKLLTMAEDVVFPTILRPFEVKSYT